MRDLLATVTGYLSRIEDRRLRSFIAEIGPDPEARALAAQSVPVADCMREAVSRMGPREAEVGAAFLRHAERLRWGQTYRTAEMGAAFMAAYGWVELIGARGHFVHRSIACGLLALGPDVLYPDHRHRAEEIYVPLSGDALWKRGDEGFAPRAAGEVIHHPSEIPHAMRTRDRPLLALYVWRGGDLAEKSKFDAKPNPEEAPNG